MKVLMTLIIVLSFCMISFATDYQGRITRLILGEKGLLMLTVEGGLDNSPCPNSYAYHYAYDVNELTDKDKVMQSMIMSAFHSNNKVIIYGTNQCASTLSVELMRAIIVLQKDY